MITPLPGEDRRNYLLRVASWYILHTNPERRVDYDQAICDGYCLAEDCLVAAKNAFDIQE